MKPTQQLALAASYLISSTVSSPSAGYSVYGCMHACIGLFTRLITQLLQESLYVNTLSHYSFLTTLLPLLV